MVSRPFPKLAFKYFGPYSIKAKIGPLAYELELPPGSLVHPVFHVSQLKPHVASHIPVFADLPPGLNLDVLQVEPEAILEHKLVKKGNNPHVQVLIKWSQLPDTMTSWEDYDVLRERFPKVAAWGQAATQAGGNVTLMDSMTIAQAEEGKKPP